MARHRENSGKTWQVGAFVPYGRSDMIAIRSPIGWYSEYVYQMT